MNVVEKIINFLEKLQKLPEDRKKIILWSVVAVLAVVMGFFWIKGAINNFSKIGESIGKIEFPQIDVSSTPSLPDLSALENITPGDQDLINPDLLENFDKK